MDGWKGKFEPDKLERGREYCQNGRVTDLKEIKGGYKASVLGSHRFEVTIKKDGGTVSRMGCICPVARGGRNCAHMAAVLFAVEAKETAAGEKAGESRKEMEQEEEERNMRRLARKARKEEKERKKEEQKRKAEEARRIEADKRLAEEERRREIREQKAREAKRRAEKRQKEQEEAQRREEKRRKEQEETRLREEKRQKEQEETTRLAEEREKNMRRAQERDIEKNASEDFEQRKAEFTVLGNAWEEDLDAPDVQGVGESLEKLEKYSYYNSGKIKYSMQISPKTFKEAEKLIQEGKIRVLQVVSGYDQYSKEILGEIDASGQTDREEFKIRIVFDRTEVKHADCRCPGCRRDYQAWYAKKTSCPYKAGVLLQLIEYISTHNLGDATDQPGQQLISFYKMKRANLIIADTVVKEGSLSLIPRLTQRAGRLTVAFKIGEKRLLIIKKLDEFCRNVKNSETAVYGTNTQINHSLDNFTEEGKSWIRFINRVVREEEEFQQRMLDARSYYSSYRKSSVGGELSLFGWRLDEFYRELGNHTVEYEDKDCGGKKKEALSCAKQNPKVVMNISEDESQGDGNFHGIKVNGVLPSLYFGADTAYYIENGHLNQVESDFLQKIEGLANLSGKDAFSFHVGRNHMSDFYYSILPQLQDVVEITETEPEKFRSYLPPEARFVFYLDAEDQNVTCRVLACYGKVECQALDIIRMRYAGGVEPFRDVSAEEEVLFHAMHLLPEVDWEREELNCGGREELVYEMMEHGIQRLMQLGEVRCTNRFRGFHAVRSVKVSVGVSVSAGLLELDIATEDVPREELLDILNSYRAKKKYFRLKDGSFVNLEDSSLEMLSELMEAAHVKPKEFVKGKMHLPMYRTLYLDKMLEENEGVYSSRDSRFREVVKGFKTVKDADFEEPKSLSKIMRKYQKNGYKWLRTLETWKFGGILADDMGLGKTLQVVAVLLAAKEEKQGGTSLVVAPASLVFNWGEELERFAPQLSVSLITGTQEERRQKIEEYDKSDVLVTSYDLLKRDIVHYEDKQFAYEIIDEAQYIKNHTTAAAKAVKVIKSKIRYALTGTPIENRLSELWSIFDYLMPGFLYGYDVFKKEMETPIVKNGDEAAMNRLQKMSGPFILRRLKEDVLKDLPEKLEECRYVQFGSAQQKLYDAQVLHMRENIASQDPEEFNKNKLKMLAELTRLRQICCDPSLCFENYSGGAAKSEACLQLVQSAIDGGHRMLLFSQFTSMLDILQQKLDAEGIAYYTITGATPKKKRLELVKEFNEGDVKLFLISLKAGGVGLNLTGADVVIHYDPWWNQAVQNQATDRAHRIGQTKKVTVYKLIAKNTIEEKIQKLQETKKDLADQIISGQSGQTGSLSREDIMELLEL